MTQISQALRTTVTQRANHRCEYCRVTDRCQIGLFELDHIQPVSRGGSTTAVRRELLRLGILEITGIE